MKKILNILWLVVLSIFPISSLIESAEKKAFKLEKEKNKKT